MLRNAAKKSFKWSLLIQSTNQIFNFVITIILARILTPADFGIIGLTSIFINIAKKITDGGLTSSLIRTEVVDDRDFSTVFYFNLVFLIMIYYLLMFFLIFFYINQFLYPDLPKI